VIDSCVLCIPVLLFVRLRSVLYILEESELWFRVPTISCQFCVFSVRILVLMVLFSVVILLTVSCVCGVGLLYFRLLRSLMRLATYLVKFGLYFF
jgi:antibiotic biosynthesis monooxygenase (ABM) superfamily enzyme